MRIDAFKDGMFQWATTMTSSGKNPMFSMPLAADKTDGGFDITFMEMHESQICRKARISCTVEPVEEVRTRRRSAHAVLSRDAGCV